MRKIIIAIFAVVIMLCGVMVCAEDSGIKISDPVINGNLCGTGKRSHRSVKAISSII